ncbi:uncharacterized protein [Salvelinus alpinus]|uniref:uncharacterized protein isoform X2 n=1 Tax=Salvelinus alpinus TaxID=8036 RepID=UPI0039FBFDDF
MCSPRTIQTLRHSSRRFTTACGAQAGIKWRTENGLARSGTEYGPMTDLPDWSFAVALETAERARPHRSGDSRESTPPSLWRQQREHAPIALETAERARLHRSGDNRESTPPSLWRQQREHAPIALETAEGARLHPHQKGRSGEDGRPAPPLKGQLRRKQERGTLARRVVNLSLEVDKGMEVWREKQEEAERMQERNKSLLLKPKGNLLLKKNK